MDDSEVFAELHPALRRFAAVVRPADVDADDLIQEALARALRRGRLDDLDEPLVYLRRVIFNLAATHRRSSVRHGTLRQKAIGRLDAVADAYPSDLSELMRVPADQRAVLYLHIVEGMPHDEIGLALGISAEASRARLSRGLRQLRIDIHEPEVTS